MNKKLVSLILVLALFVQTAVLPVSFAVAQEATTEPTPTTESIDASASPVAVVEPSSTPLPTPTPTPTPTMSPAEYDVWKEQKNIQDAQQESREDEWEQHEEDQEWIANHGGSEDYYTSGQWQTDQDAAAAAVSENQNSDPLSTPDPFANQQSDPFASSNEISSTSPSSCTQQSTPSSTGSADVLASGSGDNTAIAENADSATINNNNCATIDNNSSVSGTSGGNTMTQNDSSVGMNTGDASANGQIQNNGNTNITDTESQGFASSTSGESFAEDGTAENLNTGEDSSNFSQSNDTYSLTVENNNGATVNNQMDVEGVSGNNTLTENDGNAQLTTGDVELIANMLNILNMNITGDDFLHLIVNIFGTLNGTLDLDDIATALGYADDDALEVIARNDGTGDDSQNTTEANTETTTTINNNNTAEVNNELNVTGISGQNDVSGNDGGANVLTGRIQVLANVLNFINTNMSGEKWKFIMINVFGSLNGDIVVPGTDQYLAGTDGTNGVIAENTNPGDGSTSTQSGSSIDQTTVTNTNNVELTNSIDAQGISGNNNQVGNDDGDGAHTMQTGGTDISSQLLNYLNFNITGNNWVFLIVNVFGKWMGQIVGFADNGIMSAPTEGSFAALSVGGSTGDGTQASNTNTGQDSTNSATANSSSITDVNNQNSAKVNNDINVTGISGQNNVNNNDAGTSLTTGWVEIDANLLNIINTNITGRSWMVVFLNVFGDFAGNLFFGHAAKDAYTVQNSSISNEPARGGNSENNNNNTDNQNTQSSNTSNEQTTSSTGATTPTTRKIAGKVLAVSSTEMDEQNPENETYVATEVSENPEDTEEESSNWGFGGFLSNKLGFVRDFLYNIFSKVRDLVEPMLAYFRVGSPIASALSSAY